MSKINPEILGKDPEVFFYLQIPKKHLKELSLKPEAIFQFLEECSYSPGSYSLNTSQFVPTKMSQTLIEITIKREVVLEAEIVEIYDAPGNTFEFTKTQLSDMKLRVLPEGQLAKIAEYNLECFVLPNPIKLKEIMSEYEPKDRLKSFGKRLCVAFDKMLLNE